MDSGATSFNIDAPNVTEKVDIAELGAYIDFVGRWRAASVNNIQIPSYVFLNVEYTDGLVGQAALDSYKGVTLRVEYGVTRDERRLYFTGDFAADYVAAVEWVQGFGQADQVIPFMASSSLDSFMYDSGYAEQEDGSIKVESPSRREQDVADEAALNAWRTEGDEIPFATDADLEADQAEWVARVVASVDQANAQEAVEAMPAWMLDRIQRIEAGLNGKDSAELPFLPEGEIDVVILVSKALAVAWDKVPAAKLQWALANVIASSNYNTSYPGAPLGRDRAMQALKVLADLIGDEAFAEALRP